MTTSPLFLSGQVRIRIGLPQMIAVSVIALVASMLLAAAAEVWRRRAESRPSV